MNREEVLVKLRAFDAARRGWMLAQWARISDNPRKVGFFGLFLVITSFILGRLSK
jgi:hypothetical protein